jgi:hypothetical protein
VVQVWPPLERILCSAADARRAYLLLSVAARNTRRCATFGPHCAAGRSATRGQLCAPTARLHPVPRWALRVHALPPQTGTAVGRDRQIIERGATPAGRWSPLSHARIAANRYPCKWPIIYGMGWWPGTESNRRRQPFEGCALRPAVLHSYPSRICLLLLDQCWNPPGGIIRGLRQWPKVDR